MVNNSVCTEHDLRSDGYRVADLLRSLPYWSLLIEERTTIHTSVCRGVASAPEREMLKAALITVGSGNNVSYASTTDLSDGGLRRAIAAATRRAEALTAFRLLDREHWPVARQKGHWRSPGGKDMSLRERFDYLSALDAAMQVDERIKDRESRLSSVEQHRFFLHSAGAEQVQSTWLCIPALRVTASDGRQSQSRSFSPYVQGAVTADQLLALAFTAGTASRLANEALNLLHAPDCPTGVLDVLLSPAQMTLQIHESIGHPLELDRILGDERNYAGWSFVRQTDFGTLQYGSPLLNVLFDPFETGELAGYAFDDEGTPSCYVFLYLSRSVPLYPTVIRRDLENGFL